MTLSKKPKQLSEQPAWFFSSSLLSFSLLNKLSLVLEFLPLNLSSAELKNWGPASVAMLLPYICMICFAMKTIVTFFMSFNFQQLFKESCGFYRWGDWRWGMFGTGKGFTDSVWRGWNWLLDSKSSPLYIINPVLCTAYHDVLALQEKLWRLNPALTYYPWALTSLSHNVLTFKWD